MKVVLAGGTGFIGKALVEKLVECGHQVVVLTRQINPSKLTAGPSLTFETWDPPQNGPWCRHLTDASAVINLSGEPIAARRWTAAQKHRILNSRMQATLALTRAIRGSSRKPRVLINASAIGYYGDTGKALVSEGAPAGSGFLAEVCRQWEQAARMVESDGVRVVLPRFGMVLEKDGGALAKMLGAFRWFAGGPLGSGRQWISWIHRDDVIESIGFLLSHDDISGPVNVTAPQAVTMADFCTTLGKILHRPAWLPVPAPLVKWMLGEMSVIVLSSQRVVPQRLKESGYSFRCAGLHQALQSIFNKHIPGVGSRPSAV